MKRGADIVELNTAREMLLRVKGGRLFGPVALDGFACDERLCGGQAGRHRVGLHSPDETTRSYAVTVSQKYGLLGSYCLIYALRSLDTAKQATPGESSQRGGGQ